MESGTTKRIVYVCRGAVSKGVVLLSLAAYYKGGFAERE
jgi:hypothetical protein